MEEKIREVGKGRKEGSREGEEGMMGGGNER